MFFFVDGFWAQCNSIFAALGFYFHFNRFQEAGASISEEWIQREIKKRKHDELRQDHLLKKDETLKRYWECNCWENVKEDESVINHVTIKLPFGKPLKQISLLAKIRGWELFGYVQ